jgi:hypothetical protein
MNIHYVWDEEGSVMKTKLGLICILVALVIPLSVASGQLTITTITVGDGSGTPGTKGLVIPIDLVSEQGVSVAALNFDLHFDANVVSITNVTEGSSTIAAGKQVAYAFTDADTLRLIVYGLNQTAIGDGTVVELTFDILQNAALGETPLDLGPFEAAQPDASPVSLLAGFSGSIMVESPTTFVDVPLSHWAHDYIEILYQQGYVAGCSSDPLMYCPDATMTRAESAVFVERGIHGASYLPPSPSLAVFSDVPLYEWFSKWATGLWNDGYTAGCGTDPLVYCPLQEHTRTEGTVFFLRMLNGASYVPSEPTGIFADVDVGFWGAKWIEAAYNVGLITSCETSPQLKFCPDDPLDRAMAAYMMVQAKGLSVP